MSALYGSPAKGSGVLNNEIYIGRYIWNRSQWVKDPDSAKRQRIDRPRKEWCIENVQNCESFPMSYGRLPEPGWIGRGQPVARRERGHPAHPIRRPASLRTLRRAIVAIDQRSYGCAARKDRGTTVCAGVRARRQDVDARLLSVIRDELLSPNALAELQRALREASSAAVRDNKKRNHSISSRQAELDREIANMVQAIATMGISPAISQRLTAAERERDDLRKLAASKPIDCGLSDIVPRYKRLVADLPGALAHDLTRSRAMLREIFGEIRLVESGPDLFAEFQSPLQRLAIAAEDSKIGMVAGGAQPDPEAPTNQIVTSPGPRETGALAQPSA